MLTCDVASNHALAVGDFDGDSALTANDIDLLSQAVRDGVDDLRFDVTEVNPRAMDGAATLKRVDIHFSMSESGAAVQHHTV